MGCCLTNLRLRFNSLSLSRLSLSDFLLLNLDLSLKDIQRLRTEWRQCEEHFGAVAPVLLASITYLWGVLRGRPYTASVSWMNYLRVLYGINSERLWCWHDMTTMMIINRDDKTIHARIALALESGSLRVKTTKHLKSRPGNLVEPTGSRVYIWVLPWKDWMWFMHTHRDQNWVVWYVMKYATCS